MSQKRTHQGESVNTDFDITKNNKGVDMRLAAYIVGVTRVAQAIRIRGIYP